MKLKAKPTGIESGSVFVVVLNPQDAEEIGVHSTDRVKVSNRGREAVCIVDISKGWLSKGEMGFYKEVETALSIKAGDMVDVQAAGAPRSLEFITKKMNGVRLNRQEMFAIVKDTVDRKLSEIELTAFVSSLHFNRMSMDEVVSLSTSMAETGKMLDIKEKIILDKHSVTPDTPVLLRENGEVKVAEIGSFVDETIKNSGLKYEENGAEYAENRSNIDVMVFDDDLKVSFKPLTGVFRHPTPKTVYKVNLIGNRSVKVTEFHSLFALRDGKVLSVPTKDLKVGDFVVVPRKPIDVDNHKREIKIVDELLRLNETNGIFIRGISENFKHKITQAMRQYDLVPIELVRDYNIPPEAEITVKKGNGIPTKITISDELMRILGYYAAEGYYNENGVHFSFGTHEKGLIEDLKECFKSVFGIGLTVTHPHKTAVHVNAYNTLIKIVFEKVFKVGKGAENKIVPRLVFNTSRQLQLEFLKAYIAGDGYRRRNYEITAATCSKKLFTEICYLLGMLGISFSSHKKPAGKRIFPNGYSSDIKESFYIYTQANEIFENISHSASYLNFLPVKSSGIDVIHNPLLDDYELRRSLRRNTFVTFKNANKMMGLLQLEKATDQEVEKLDDVKKLVESDLGFLPIKSIEEIKCKDDYVYDLCVEDYEKFLGGHGPIFLHNSLGGVPGDKTTMLVVPIIAAAGYKIPKTSSRAITSAAGTADRVECLCPVNLSVDEILRTVEKTNGCLAWGGAVDLAPADDMFIKVEYPLSIDPLLLPSVMSKKKAVGATHVVIDIPTGRGSKIKTIGDAHALAKDFIELGSKMGIVVNCVLTFGEEPIGYAVGPALEAREALNAISNISAPPDLVEKVVNVAGALLELAGENNGKELAYKLLKSGSAERRLRQIIESQGGDPKIKPNDIALGSHVAEIKSKTDGTIWWIANHDIVKIAREAGAPKDKGAGILLRKKMGDFVKKGEVLMEIYAEKDAKLHRAIELAGMLDPVGVYARIQDRMFISKVPETAEHKKFFILER